MHRSERLGLLLALPGMGLALAIVGLLVFSLTVCDPLYEPNRLLDMSFLREMSNGAYKRVTNDFDEKVDVFAAGGDLRFKHEGLYVSVESHVAQSWLAQSDRPWGLDVLGYISYRFDLF